MGAEKPRILISPVEDFDDELVDRVAAEIERAFDFPAERLPLIDDLSFAHDPGRNQFHSTPILERLDASAPEHYLKIIGMTRVDLFIPILTHVYGEAQLGGRACIVSTHRLKEEMKAERTFLERVAKEAVHELGHTFKLLHCKDKTCIMHYCRHISDVDRKSGDLCRYCKILLGDEVKRMGKAGD